METTTIITTILSVAAILVSILAIFVTKEGWKVNNTQNRELANRSFRYDKLHELYCDAVSEGRQSISKAPINGSQCLELHNTVIEMCFRMEILFGYDDIKIREKLDEFTDNLNTPSPNYSVLTKIDVEILELIMEISKEELLKLLSLKDK